MAQEAMRIAVEHMTPVFLLTDGYIANGAEPWPIPNIADLKPIKVHHPTEPNANGDAVVAYSDHVEVGPTFNGVTLGRKPGATGRLVPLAQSSLGAANGPHATADVVVTEIQYHPDQPRAVRGNAAAR